ncbi:MAG: hypothetical protein FWF99_03995 [Desulfovibrionaceae bacterium]|nr:hypothetical protein [Desulfovibrionaceae bacterium]
MDYEANKRHDRDYELSAASHESLIWHLLNLCLWPIKFIITNLPAAGPAWVGTYFLTDPIFSIFGIEDSNEYFFSRLIAVAICFFLLTFAVWGIFNFCLNYAERRQDTIGHVIKGAIMAYIFLGYALVCGFIAANFAPDSPLVYLGAGLVAGLIGTGFYLGKIRHNAMGGSGVEEMHQKDQDIDAEYEKKVEDIKRKYD